MKKFLIFVILFNIVAVLMLPAIISAQTGSPECCKIRANMGWSSEPVMSKNNSTLKNTETGADVTCTNDPSTTPCKCSDSASFEKGCTLIDGNTVGGSSAVCSMENKAGTKNQPPDYIIQAWGMVCLLQMLYGVVNWIFIILTALAAILVIFGAFQILTSGGSPDKMSSGRNMILYAAIGLLIAFLAKAVPGIVKAISGF